MKAEIQSLPVLSKKVIKKLSDILENIIELNNLDTECNSITQLGAILKTNQIRKFSTFNLPSSPKISLYSYLSRIVKYTKMELSSFIMSFALMDKFFTTQKFYLTERNIHKVVLIALIVSMKINEDFIYKNSFLAEIGGIPLSDLNQLEEQFLSLLDYELFICEDEFRDYLEIILEEASS